MRYEVTAPDGTRWEVNAPEGASEAEVMAYAQKQWQSKRPTTGYTAENLRNFALSSPIGAMARGVKDVIDTGALGLATLYDKATGADRKNLSSLVTGQAPGEAARVRAMNEAGKADFKAATEALGAPPAVLPAVGRFAGNLAATAPAINAAGAVVGTVAPRLGAAITSGGMSTGAAPAATRLARAGDMAIRTAGGAVGGGVSAGLVNPEDAAQGAAIGAAAPAIVQGLGRAGMAVGRALGPNINNPELARKAVQEYQIPLGPADMSASRGTKALRSVLNDAPFVGGIGERQAQAVQGGFNRAIGKTFGAEADSLTPEVLDGAKKRMGAEFDRIWNQNRITVDVKMAEELAALRAEVDKLPQGEGARLRSWLEDVASKAMDDGAGNYTIPGDVANRLQSTLRKEADKAQGFLKDALSNLRRTVIGGFNRSVSPDDAAALSKNMGQYKAFKTVEPLLQGAEAGVAGRAVGDVPAALLPQAVRQSYRGNIADSPFADLSQIGSQFVADRVARTGGSTRAMIQNSALGGALTFGALTEPLTLAAIPAGATLQKALGSPALANALLQAQQRGPQVTNALMNPEILRLIGRAAPIAGSDR